MCALPIPLSRVGSGADRVYCSERATTNLDMSASVEILNELPELNRNVLLQVRTQRTS